MSENPYLRAIEVIKERGWWQGDWEGPNGEVCISESLRVAGAFPSTVSRLQRAMCVVGPAPGRLRFGPADWNDAPERTIEDVYLALKLAAADWDAEHGAGREASA